MILWSNSTCSSGYILREVWRTYTLTITIYKNQIIYSSKQTTTRVRTLWTEDDFLYILINKTNVMYSNYDRLVDRALLIRNSASLDNTTTLWGKTSPLHKSIAHTYSINVLSNTILPGDLSPEPGAYFLNFQHNLTNLGIYVSRCYNHERPTVQTF